jgi:hypothetical protein
MASSKTQHTFLSLSPVHHSLTRFPTQASTFLALSPVRHNSLSSPSSSPVSSPVLEPKFERSNSDASDASVQFLPLGHVESEPTVAQFLRLGHADE